MKIILFLSIVYIVWLVAKILKLAYVFWTNTKF